MRADLDRPFRIVVLGNFCGDSNRPTTALHPIRVDRDNLDQVMLGLGVRLDGIKIDSNSYPCAVSISSMEDFHPDRLFETLTVFEPLRRVRERLRDSASVDDVVGDLIRLRVSSENPSSSPQSAPPVTDLPEEAGLIDAILLEQMLELHPCGERLITDSMAKQLLTLGITPLRSMRHRDVAPIPQLISLSGGKLRGRWLD